jgi:predicted Zn-dependent protease
MALILSGGCASGALSVAEEKSLGSQVQAEVQRQLVFVRDRTIVTYVRRLGEELAKAAPVSPYSLRFFVIDDPSLNAFAIPGGAIYINTGVVLNAKDVSELAGVMAHEIGHVTQRHVAKSYEKSQQTGFFANLLAIVVAIGSGGRYNASLPAALAAQAYLGQFSRADESESDRVAVETLARANYEPLGLVNFFETVKKEAGDGDALFQFLASHPAPATRIADAKALIAKLENPGERRTDDGGKFAAIQARVKLFLGNQDDLGRDEEGGDDVKEEGSGAPDED